MNDWHQLHQLVRRSARSLRRISLWPISLEPTRGALVLLMGLSLVLTGCGGSRGDRFIPGGPNDLVAIPKTLQEVSPPATLQALKRELDLRPQVRITSPKRGEVLQDNRVSVQFQVSDLPTFKDEALGMGPHLNVIVDNEPYRALYDPSEPLILEDLEPGTHTVQAFASRPWHESFKTAGAYDQTQFHVFTKTPAGPDLDAPLLTYSRPKGSYGAEPIMLDVYLQNAPLHLVAQEDITDEVSDWKVRCTINGQTFTFDAWEPLYLAGFKPGKNWIQLELLDENDQPIDNAYNNTARLITLAPGGDDALSKLVRDELSLQEARPMIIAGYEPPKKALDAGALGTEALDTEALDTEAPGTAGPLGKENPVNAPGANAANTAGDLPIDNPTIEAPEPIALPETKAFPPGILTEETLPELLPKAEPAPTPTESVDGAAASKSVPESGSASLKAPVDADPDFLESTALDVPPVPTAPSLKTPSLKTPSL
ncbi:MAG: hypothetical protein ACFB5Z_14400 [Elainellaceae cyanobacterium]